MRRSWLDTNLARPDNSNLIISTEAAITSINHETLQRRFQHFRTSYDFTSCQSSLGRYLQISICCRTFGSKHKLVTKRQLDRYSRQSNIQTVCIFLSGLNPESDRRGIMNNEQGIYPIGILAAAVVGFILINFGNTIETLAWKKVLENFFTYFCSYE